MIKYPVFTLIIIFSMMACQSPKEKADLIIHNALVYTVDEKFSIQQAFAVKDGKFIAIGTDESILEKFEADSIIDMRGNPVYPGFIDAHCHFFGYGYCIRS